MKTKSKRKSHTEDFEPLNRIILAKLDASNRKSFERFLVADKRKSGEWSGWKWMELMLLNHRDKRRAKTEMEILQRGRQLAQTCLVVLDAYIELHETIPCAFGP